MLLRRAARGPPGLWQAHLQVFLAVRDAQRSVAVLRLRGHPDVWALPSENVFEGRDPAAVAAEVAARWFRTPLALRLAGTINYPPEDGDGHWMVLLVYDADAPPRLEPAQDTLELRFAAPGQAAPGPMFKDHASVLARLPR